MKKLNLFLIASAMLGLIVSCGGPSSSDLDKALNDLDKLSSSLDSLDNVDGVDEVDAQGDKFYSKDGKFKVNFTGEPELSKDTVGTDVGTIQMYMYMYEKSATEIEMLAYSDYPSSMVEQSNADDLLQGAKNGAVNNLNATVTEENKIDFNGNPGLEFKADNGQYYVHYKLVLKNNRLYQIALMRDGAQPSDEAINNFIKTFEIVD